MTIANARMSSRPPAIETSTAHFAEDVAYYLTQTPRQLPSRYFYDPLGSALFEAICQLPWYLIARAEGDLLARHASEIFRVLAPLSHVVELGSGSGEKLAVLLAAGRTAATLLHLHLVDVSAAALATAARALSAFDGVHVITHQAPYEIGLEDVSRERPSREQHVSGRTLALFLGSNIGNFDPPGAEALLRRIRSALRQGDAFLLGADLVKPERDLLLAYDDPLGVTSAFNRNLLARVNRELGGDFDLAGFEHLARWDAAHSRVEMHLVSTRAQRVRIPAAALEIQMAPGEAIWTESSYKYAQEQIVRMLERCGFRQRAQWLHEEARFALTLVEA
jgi:L-histidine Nalpha-methyltransferase